MGFSKPTWPTAGVWDLAFFFCFFLSDAHFYIDRNYIVGFTLMLVSNCGYGSKLSQRTGGVISSKSKSKHLVDLINMR